MVLGAQWRLQRRSAADTNGKDQTRSWPQEVLGEGDGGLTSSSHGRSMFGVVVVGAARNRIMVEEANIQCLDVWAVARGPVAGCVAVLISTLHQSIFHSRPRSNSTPQPIGDSLQLKPREMAFHAVLSMGCLQLLTKALVTSHLLGTSPIQTYTFCDLP